MFILLINVKMSTYVDILTFVSGINFMLSSVKHEKEYSSEPEIHCSLKRNHSDVMFILLINVKISTTAVDILTFMIGIDVMLS